MMMYTIKEIAGLAGVSTRTLRYYDEIGLLPPAGIGDNGYRLYDRESLLRLQQILFFRELDLPLKEIARMLNRPDFDALQALERHRAALRQRARQLAGLIETVDRTIATLKGEGTMADQDYFRGFDESEYEEEARERWGDTPQYVESTKRWASYSEAEREALKEEGGRITARMMGEGPNPSPADPDVQAAVADYQAYISRYFYPCSPGMLRALSEMWVADPRFAANYERIREGGAEFVREAVQIYCGRNG
jgi:DNA-binding transcriptional MerR regulator